VVTLGDGGDTMALNSSGWAIDTGGNITGTTWAGTTIAPTYGGTGLASYSTGDTLYASAANTLAALGIGTSGYVLRSNGTIPYWSDNSMLGTDDQTLAEVYAESGNAVQLTAGYGDIRFYNDGASEMLFLDESNGRVGIGTTSPLGKLQVVGDEVRIGAGGTLNYAAGDGDLYVQDDLEVDGTIYGNVSGTINPGFTTGSVIFQDASGLDEDPSQFFWDDGSNYLGIGKSNPAYGLDVSGSVGIGGTLLSTAGDTLFIDDDIMVMGNDIKDSTATTRLSLGTTNVLTGHVSITGNTILGDASGDTITSNAASWTFANDTNITLSGGVNGLSFDTNTLSIDASSDRVGIGTTAPGYKLHLLGTVDSYLGYLSNGSTGSSAGGMYIRSDGEADILTLNYAGTDVMNVSGTQATFGVPTSFTSSGDVSIAYDLVFTNQSASYIKSNAPFYIEAGESFESNNLTLRTYNSGDVVFDAGGGITLAQAQAWDIADSSTTSLNIESGLLNLDTTIQE